MSRKYKIKSCLICDIARKELGGKDILVGVYGGAIIVPEVPTMLSSFAIWLQIHADKTEYKEMKLEVVAPDGQVLITGKGKLKFTDTEFLTGLPLQFPTISLPEEGVYTIRFGLESEPVKIAEFRVSKGEVNETL